MKWEYYTFKLNTKASIVSGPSLNSQMLNNHLNHIGVEGWELVSAMDINIKYGVSKEIVFIFKRPISENRKPVLPQNPEF